MKKPKKLLQPKLTLTRAALLVVVALAIGTAIYTVKNSLADNTGGTGGAHTDQTFLQYTAAGYTSQYHLYAAGLDWPADLC
jgi:uncharacterized membrane protein YraQ (UPF0718 family)